MFTVLIFPVAIGEPPEATVYHLKVAPAEGVADMVTEPAPQREPARKEITEGVVLMVAVTTVRGVEVHPLFVTLTW